MLNVRKCIWCKTVRSAVKAAAVVIPYDKKTVESSFYSCRVDSIFKGVSTVFPIIWSFA